MSQITNEPCPFCGRSAVDPAKYGLTNLTMCSAPPQTCAGTMAWVSFEKWNARANTSVGPEAAEPVAWRCKFDHGGGDQWAFFLAYPTFRHAKAIEVQPLFTRPFAALETLSTLPVGAETAGPAYAYQAAEERLCECGAAGSGEGHSDFCPWLSSQWKKWGDAFNAVGAETGETVAWRWQTNYTDDTWHYAEEVSFSPRDIELGIVKNITPLYTHPSASREVTDDLRLAFRNADESDWKHLFAVLPDTGHGRFWKGVLTEARAALLAALPEREG